MPYVNASGFTAYDNDNSMFVVPKTKRPLIFVYFQPASEDYLYQFRVTARWNNVLVIAGIHFNQLGCNARRSLKLNPDSNTIEFGGHIFNRTATLYTLHFESIVPYWVSRNQDS